MRSKAKVEEAPIYVKSEHSLEPHAEESDKALTLAKEIVKLYDMVEKENNGLKSKNKFINNY